MKVFSSCIFLGLTIAGILLHFGEGISLRLVAVSLLASAGLLLLVGLLLRKLGILEKPGN
jgi:hypothetical protein